VREPYLQVTWTDPVTGCHGYLVIDRLVRGVSSGGLRMRAGCTLDEVRGLAAGVSVREALNYDPGGRYIPLGGARGGIDWDPCDPRATDVLRRYLTAMRPYVERFWTMGEDLGLRQSTIDKVLAELGFRSAIQAVYPLLDDEQAARDRLSAAYAVRVDGLALDELVGGCGVSEAVLVGLERLSPRTGDVRAFVQGFGPTGGSTARFLSQAGIRVVGIADTHGIVANEDGLDVERLLRGRDAHGGMDRDDLTPGDHLLPAEKWLDVEAEVLVPAALSYAVDERNVDSVRARLVVEAATMPVLPAAERVLFERGALVIPDMVANSACDSWWWWTLFGDVQPDSESAFAKVRASMRRLAGAVLDEADRARITPRVAAARLADSAVRDIDARFGTAA
jgi:glutamate dehydrogenase (NAD(P)+)